jgi:Flp pilus assembly protein TadG
MRRFGRQTLLRDERGASLVEFALVLPLLVVLLFGIIEASWAFAQQNDVRHGAREGARLATVDFGNVATIAQEVCDRMDVVYPSETPTVTLTPILPGAGGLGDTAQITVSSSPGSLTGVIDAVFGGLTMSSTIEFRLEQPTDGTAAQWWAGGAGGTFTCP